MLFPPLKDTKILILQTWNEILSVLEEKKNAGKPDCRRLCPKRRQVRMPPAAPLIPNTVPSDISVHLCFSALPACDSEPQVRVSGWRGWDQCLHCGFQGQKNQCFVFLVGPHVPLRFTQTPYPRIQSWCWIAKNRNDRCLLLLLSSFIHVGFCATPQLAAHQASLSLGLMSTTHLFWLY